MATPATILIVEDEGIIALDLRETLTGLGYQVMATVPSGEEAVQLVASAPRPDLVLMDIRLSGAMSGLDAALLLRERYGVPSLFLTSYADREMIDQAKAAEAIGYLLKPFDERSLAIHIELALHRVARESAPESGRPATDFPCLQIRSLGQFEMTLGERTLHSENFSRTQRELLALLLCSPQLRITREEVELALWPDSPPERARSSFDSLLLRLRKTLQAGLASTRTKDYLVFQKGILTLENCSVDAHRFLNSSDEAQQLARRSEPAATARLCDTLSCWGGDYMPGVSGGEQVDLYRDRLRRSYVVCARKLASLLIRDGQLDAAATCLKQSVLIDPGNDELITELYRLLVKGHQLGQARQLMQQYAEQLQAAGFSRIEITAAVRSITAGAEGFRD